jgi:hypothetical protein
MSKTSSLVNAAQLAALARIRGGLGNVRSATLNKLLSLGFVSVRYVEREESYRPSRGFSPVRWTRNRLDRDVRLTDEGSAFLARHEANAT